MKKILHLLTREPSASEAEIIAVQEREQSAEVVDLRETGDYAEIVAQIEAADLVISW